MTTPLNGISKREGMFSLIEMRTHVLVFFIIIIFFSFCNICSQRY